jgi:hypothetical protein
MADVYKATDRRSDRLVALKVLRGSSSRDEERFRRFEREAWAASRLRNRNSIQVSDFGVTPDGLVYLAMDFVCGPTLARVIAEEAPLDDARALHIGAQILSALMEAHALGIVHRDLKPANVMLELSPNGTELVKVVDFGIATSAGPVEGEARLTQEGMVYGTPGYMSPEQIRGEELDGRSDLYAVGVMLFEMLTGALPFEAPTPVGIAAKHLSDPPPRLTDRRPARAVDPVLEAIVTGALEKSPAMRAASAAAMRDALLACAKFGRPVPPRELPVTAPLSGADVAKAKAVKRSPREGDVDAIFGAVRFIPAMRLLSAKGNLVAWRRRYVLERYGQGTLDAMAAQLRGEAREYLLAPPSHFAWVLNGALMDIDEAIVRGPMEGDVTRMRVFGWEIGRGDLSTVYRLLIRLAVTPHMLIRRLVSMYPTYFTPGEFVIEEVGAGTARVALNPGSTPLPLYQCNYGVVGWLSSALELSGARNVNVEQWTCVHRGDPACRYVFKWS